MSIQLKFCGAAGVVTGSSYLMTAPDGTQFLIDCGMFQGTKTLRELNYADFPFDPKTLSFVLLTHAHIDHSGLLPKLCRQGFTGSIYTTEATQDLLRYMLQDSAGIQEMETEQLNRRNTQRGIAEIEPIYTRADADTCIESISPVAYNTWTKLPGGVEARFWNAGHILGSASIELKVGGKTILFSGDLGPQNKMFQPAPESPHDIDYLVVESTYGGRKRGDSSIEARRARLQEEIMAAVDAGGNILIPSFAVERTQEILFDIDWLIENSRIPEMPLFIDSPLATQVTGVFEKYRHELEDMSGCADSPFKGRNIHYTRDVSESKALNRIKSGAIIMAGSGMCDAGRIRHHLKNNLWNPACTVLFVGYQAEGTLGKFIQSGQKKVRILGEEVDVRARIASIETYSAHADQSELLDWVAARLPVRGNVFITHGTDENRAAMREQLTGRGLSAERILMPVIDEIFVLDADAAQHVDADGKPRLTAQEASATSDWHNDYARFVLDLAEYLRRMKDPESRRGLLTDLGRHIRNGGSHARK